MTNRFPIRRVLLPLAILAGTVGIVSVLFATRPQVRPMDSPERVWPVEAVAADFADHAPEIELFGQIVSGRRSELRALVAGPVIRIGDSFREGGLVSRGDLLVAIDPFDYEIALKESVAQAEQAKARLELLEKEAQRAEKLFAEGTVPEQFKDTAVLDLRQQKAVVEQREAQVEKAQRNLRQTRLRAPFSGVLLDVNTDLGRQLSTNDQVATLIDTGELEVRFTLSNAQFGRLLASGEQLEGRPLAIVWEVGSERLEYRGTVDRVAAEVAAASGGVDLFGRLDTDANQSLLRPGAFVSTRLPDRTYSNMLRIPETALYGDGRVFVIEEGRLAEREVRVAGFQGSDLFVEPAKPGAIADGDLIVTTQIREGGPGVRVEVKP